MKPTSVSFPSFIEPMQALLVEKLPEGDWLYGVKLDALTETDFCSFAVLMASQNEASICDPSAPKAVESCPTIRLMSRANGGSSAVDGQSFEGIKHQGVEGWLEHLAQELRIKTWRSQAKC
jgi:hypothetical protein